MKKLALLALLAGLTTNVNAMKPEPQDKLSALWKEYEILDKADKPAQSAEKLKEIRDLAIQTHSPYDFFEAGTRYISAVERRNWKKRDEVRSEFAGLVTEFDCPIVSYRYLQAYGDSRALSASAFLQKNASRLKEEKNPSLWAGVNVMNGVLKKYIADDYEYVLWHMMFQYRNTKNELEAYITEDYPKKAYLRYYAASFEYPDYKRDASMRSIVQDYPGTAVSLYARQSLLFSEFGSLNRSDKTTQQDYKDFYSKCKAFIKDKDAMKGEEATIAKGLDFAENTCNTLTAKDLTVYSGGDSIEVRFRNLSSASVVMAINDNGKAGRTVGKWNIKNSKGSFYVIDSEKVSIPAVDDGEYLITAASGKLESTCLYSKYTISLAQRRDDDAFRVYAASWRTGKPLEQALFKLKAGTKVVATSTLRLDGWTAIPKEWVSLIDKNDKTYYTISCEYKDGSGLLHSSPDLGISEPWRYYRDPAMESKGCRIFKDRGAYNPGDTVKFKVILFKGNYIDNMAVQPGEELTVKLYNAEGKEIDSRVLTTNELGSAASSFVLPTGQRNGMFRIVVKAKAGNYEEDTFRVDEFVLPTFFLEFEPQKELFLPGDRVTVSGKVGSYSGHSLRGARIEFKVTRWNTVVFQGEETPGDDGSFSTAFKAMEAGMYKIAAKVTDATGETHEFCDFRFICNNINVEIEPCNASAGTFVTLDEDRYNDYIPMEYSVPRIRHNNYNYVPKMLLRTGEAVMALNVRDSDGNMVPGDVDYALVGEKGDTLTTGKTVSGGTVRLDMSAMPDGLYTFKAKTVVEGKNLKDEAKCQILKQVGDVLDAPVRRFFVPGPTEVPEGGDIRLIFGSADGPTWATVSLFGDRNQLLEARSIVLSGERGVPGNVTDISFEYKDSYPDAVRLVVFYFKKGKEVNYDIQYTRRRTLLDLPLSFTSFTDKALPATTYTVTLNSGPGAEAVASVYDKSIDAISPNFWNPVRLHGFSAAYVDISSARGRITGFDPESGEQSLIREYSEEESFNGGDRMLMKAAGAPLPAPVEMAVMTDSADAALEEGAGDENVTMRTDFSEALSFEPFLRADENGNISFDFTTSDKLSTYYVKVYAHDKDMRNALAEGEVMVTIPVKVSLIEPGYLYEGDVLRPGVSVSSNSDVPVSGKLTLYVYPGENYSDLKPSSVKTVPLTVPASGVASASFEVPAKGDCIGLKAVFSADKYSDAMFVAVPVKDVMQTLTESHSAVLLPGMSEKEVVSRLRKQFVNVKGSAAQYSEITLLDMVKEAIPKKKDPQGKDVLSLSEAYYVRLLSASLEGKESDERELLGKIMACRNSDGGFGWFEGMNSSSVITAVMLERFARLKAAGFDVPDLSSSAKYLDHTHFGAKLPYWCGWISDAQYMYVRSMYAEVPFTEKSSKELQEFRKDAVAYLTPSEKDGRGLKGRILDKARRMLTLQRLSASREGVSLAASWGVTTLTDSRLKASMMADVESLLDYAVEHPDGGWYYPNAVMPWRGLLESEAYAHSLLCDLMASVDGVPASVKPRPEEVADGIRLWLMLQKETQKWGEDPAFVDAISSIMRASDEVLATKVMIMKAEYTKPFVEVKASGNGFTLKKEYYREDTVRDEYKDGEEKDVRTLQLLRPGDPVRVGDKIIAKYVIWNQENRSFVRLSASREASLRPVDELSGRIGWWLTPLRVEGWYSLSPQGYRDVKTDRSEYWFDSYPEENTTITEEFFVTQSGSFKAPVITIESLYAPHYRANAAFWGTLTSDR